MDEVEPASAEDAPAIAAVEAAAAFHPWTAAAVAASLASPTTRAWVVRERGRVVAHLLATAVLDEGELLTVAVHPDARRRGLGRRLLAACHAAWSAEGVGRGFLEVRADNAPARALYAAEGWRELGLRRGYYREGGDAVLMAWEPGPTATAG